MVERMFDTTAIRGIEAQVRRFAAGFDAGAVEGAEAVMVMTAAARTRNMLTAIIGSAAKQVGDTHAYRREGFDSAAHRLAHASGTSVAQARAAVDTQQQVQALPDVAAAQRSGVLSPEKTTAIADAATADPSAARRLLRLADKRSLGEVRDACARVKATADADLAATHRRIRASRGAMRHTTPDGSGVLTYRSTIDEVNEVWAVVSGFATRAFDEARLDGKRESGEAYAADGVLAMARAAAAMSAPRAPQRANGRVRSAVPKTIVFRCDWDAIVRGRAEGTEVCDIAGVGPIPVSVVRDLVEHGDPFIAAVITKGVDVVSVAHLGRSPTAYQRTAPAWQQPACERLGCNHTMRLENDHRDDWARTRRTPTQGLDRLCQRDHELKTRRGWALVSGTGKRPMVPPGHPDHPGSVKRARQQTSGRDP
jgi:hypothetical protein